MKRSAGLWVLLAALSGCVGAEQGATRTCGGGWGGGFAATVPGLQGPWGQPVPMTGPYSALPTNEMTARALMSQSVPLNAAQYNPAAAGSSGIMQAGYTTAGGPSGIMQAGGACPPPPGAGLMPPGLAPPPGAGLMPPGLGAPPGGGLMPPGMAGPMGPGMPPAGAVAAAGALPGGVPSQFPTHRTSVRFVGPPGMKVSWYAPTADGKAGFTGNQLTAPGRYNFLQAAIYRLKISNLPNRPGLELYPTLEVVPSNAKTDTFLAHSAVPVNFTDEDLDQVVAGNFVVKVVYLPYPQFQDLATSAPDEVVSTRLEPGVDPLAEAVRRGNVLVVVRLGNIDLEAPNTPAMDAGNPYQAKPMMIPKAMPPAMGGPRPGPMVPFGFMNQGKPLMMGPNGPVLPPPGSMGPVSLPNAIGTPGGGTPSGMMMPGNAGPVSQLPDGMLKQTKADMPQEEVISEEVIDEDATPPAPSKQSWWQRVLSRNR